MSYTEWFKSMAKLPATAEFCLSDVSEKISVGNINLQFLITEELGEDPDPKSRKQLEKKKVCRTRIYCIAPGNSPSRLPSKVEIREIEISHPNNRWLRDFYARNSRICDSVLASLKNKVEVISERSKAILESQMGEEVRNLITARLSGEHVADMTLKEMLISQLIQGVLNHVVVPVRQLLRNNISLQTLTMNEWEEGLVWSVSRSDQSIFASLNWKKINVNWGSNSGNLASNENELCVRDAFLFLVNMQSFGRIIIGRIEKNV